MSLAPSFLLLIPLSPGDFCWLLPLLDTLKGKMCKVKMYLCHSGENVKIQVYRGFDDLADSLTSSLMVLPSFPCNTHKRSRH